MRRIDSAAYAVQPYDGEVCEEVSVTGARKFRGNLIKTDNWKQVSVELEAWREAFTVQMTMDVAKQNIKQNTKIKKGREQIYSRCVMQWQVVGHAGSYALWIRAHLEH